MIEFLQRLFLGHSHKWEIIDEGKLQRCGRHVGDYFIQKCSVCGKIKETRC